jgi:hypothetical protein
VNGDRQKEQWLSMGQRQRWLALRELADSRRPSLLAADQQPRGRAEEEAGGEQQQQPPPVAAAAVDPPPPAGSLFFLQIRVNEIDS